MFAPIPKTITNTADVTPTLAVMIASPSAGSAAKVNVDCCVQPVKLNVAMFAVPSDKPAASAMSVPFPTPITNTADAPHLVAVPIVLNSANPVPMANALAFAQAA
jgi:hypothetical protein